MKNIDCYTATANISTVIMNASLKVEKSLREFINPNLYSILVNKILISNNTFILQYYGILKSSMCLNFKNWQYFR